MLKPLRIKWAGFLLIIFPLVFYSCIEKELDFDSIRGQRWASHWAVPLVNSTLDINDFLNDSSDIIAGQGNEVLRIIYESDELVSIRADEITEIPNQEKTEQREFNLPDVPVGIMDSISVVFDFTFELDEEDEGLRIDSMRLTNGFYHFKSSTDIDRDVSSITYTVSNFIHIETNQPMRFEMEMNNSTGGIIERDTVLDLSFYKLRFDHAFSDTNVVSIVATIKFLGDNDPNNSPYFLHIMNDFYDMEFLRFFGYIGQQEVQIDDTITLDIFDNDLVGNFLFGEGSVGLTIDIDNSFGLPVKMEIEKFKAYRETEPADSLDIFLFGEGNPASFEILSPDYDQIGQVVPTEVVSDISNMHEALSLSPQKLYVDINALLNYNNLPDASNFILDSSTIKAKMTLDLELFGSVDDFEVIDTVEFNLNNTSEFESLFFVAEVENGFPVTLLLKLDFVDSLYKHVYTLFPEGEQLLVAAGVGSPPDYRVTSPGLSLTEIELPKEDLEILEDARSILLSATLSTEAGQEVKLYSDYEIILRLGAKVGIYY
jgi:hypothetical protein